MLQLDYLNLVMNLKNRLEKLMTIMILEILEDF